MNTAFIRNVIGSDKDFSLGEQVFHGVNLATAVLLVFIILTDLMLGLRNVYIVLFSIMGIHGFIYYLSRFRRKFTWALVGLMIAGYGGMSACFFTKEGIDGPFFLIAFFIAQLLVAVSQRRFHLLILGFNFVVVGVLLQLQYFHPALVGIRYQTNKERFIDMYMSFMLLCIFSYITIRILLDKYNKEKENANRQTRFVEEKHMELERATRDKDRLFSIVFHDLKSPLGSIQMYLERFEQLALGQEEDQKMRQRLLVLTRSTASMLESMLLWIREQVNFTEPQLRLVEITAVIGSAVAIEMPYARRKDVRLLVRETAPVEIAADPVMIQILTRTLINNAIKFSPAGAAVIISTEILPEVCIVSIKDAGEGISDERKPLLFTAAAGATYGTSQERGMGIGLMLARQFAERQGIRLWFETEVGRGSVFSFSIKRS
ncbi:MAG: HAMP domain-containing histidine kinase [Niabella sp.]|nr:HAMP domain-containing histidine kinase [Niabella sp.]